MKRVTVVEICHHWYVDEAKSHRGSLLDMQMLHDNI